ncbi:MAG: quinone oxidoreductase [Verrucomicrobiales bacterium]|nr:quinone oxidoreductase [Verrucomicrobiales bacterium]
MKAAYINEPGPPENIVYGEIPDAEVSQGKVLVRVAAVSVNPIDTYIRSGAVAMQLPKPYIVGNDLAGTVEAVGDGVTGLQTGDRVWCSNQGIGGRQGTSSEWASIDAEWLHALPDSVSFEDAAANALVGITAHLGLKKRARLSDSDTLFINGGSGGVGSMAVQMAKAIGARVITTAGSDDRAEKCRELGADLAINYKSENVTEAVKQFAPDGVNVYWETRRETDFETILPQLAKHGRIIVMAGREARPVLPIGPFYVKDCELHGFAMFNYNAEQQREAAADMNQWMKAGQLKSNIGRELPLSEAAAAQRLQEDNTIRCLGSLAGKIVLKP